jgi:uncharacterized Fe-S radical SAM superfamily protein PflX
MQKRTACARDKRVHTLRRGGLSAGLERVGDDLFRVVPQILEALLIAINGGLRLPLVYNTSSYDSMDSIRLMDGVVDIYMPDFKLWDSQRSLRYLPGARFSLRRTPGCKSDA